MVHPLSRGLWRGAMTPRSHHTAPSLPPFAAWIAICQYLAARFSAGTLDVAVQVPDFGRYLNYVLFGEATLTFPQTLVLRYTRFETPTRRQPQVAEDYSRWFLARLRTLEPVLAKSESFVRSVLPWPTYPLATHCFSPSILA